MSYITKQKSPQAYCFSPVIRESNYGDQKLTGSAHLYSKVLLVINSFNYCSPHIIVIKREMPTARESSEIPKCGCTEARASLGECRWRMEEETAPNVK